MVSSQLARWPLSFQPSGTFSAVWHCGERGGRQLVTLKHVAILTHFGNALDRL